MHRIASKQRTNRATTHAADVTVPRVVEAEVVPDDGPAGDEEPIDLTDEVPCHTGIEDRGQHGEEEHDVERAGWKVESLGVADLEAEVRMAPASGRDQVGQEVDAAEALRRRAERGEARKHLARSAADLEDARAVERGPVRGRQQLGEHALPLRDDGAVPGVGRRPAPFGRPVPRVGAIDGGDTIDFVRGHASSATIPARGSGAMPADTLSVVVCTRNRPAALAVCVDSLAAQTRRAGELVVVDGGTLRLPARFRRRIRKRLRGTRVRFLATLPGLPRQRNLGATMARGSIVVFLDDDVVLEPGYLAAIADVYARDPEHVIGGVGGAQIPDPTPHEGPWRQAACRLFLQESHGEGRLKRSGRPSYLLSPTDEQPVEFLSGCNMSFRREVLTELDFDERLCGYALGEDLDFSYRVSRRWALVVTPDARCDHRQVPGGRPETDAFRAMSIFNKYLFFREHVAHNPIDWVAFLWASLGGVALRLRAPAARGLRGVARGYWLVTRHLLTGALPPEPTTTPPPAMRPARPLVSVVVPARDEERTLGACLASIRAQAPIAGGFEVVVVENGSCDRTRAIADAVAAEDPRVRVVVSDARNHSEAMNEGVLAARGEVIARVDAHSRIAPDYLRRVTAALRRHPQAAGVGGPFQPAGETPLERAIGLARSSPFGVGGGYGTDRETTDHPVRSVQCGAYWRDALVEAGLFDPAMAYGEDEELNWRLVQRGTPLILCPALRQPYRPRARLGGLLEQYWRYGQGRARVLGKHPGFLSPRHLAPSVLLMVLAVLGLGTLAGSARAAGVLLVVLGAYAIVLGAAWLRVRTAPPREAALVPVAIACMHLGYGAGLVAGAVGLAWSRRRGLYEDPPMPAFDRMR